MCGTALLIDTLTIRLEKVVPASCTITLVVRAVQGRAECPRCGHLSTRVHSRYTRIVADLPWQGVAVRLQLHTRRFRCTNELCVQSVFCERLPSVVAHYARKTTRLNNALSAIAHATGGEVGARITRALGMAISPDSLLRHIRRINRTAPAAPEAYVRVLGVDDFALKRGQRYGTLLVDLERQRPVDLLLGREAETLTAWLKAHPSVKVITRDRWRAYAKGILEGAPQSTQVADRWHLLKNLRDALEQFLRRVLPAAGKRVQRSTLPPEEHERTSSEHTEQSRIRLLPHLLRNGPTSKRAPPLRLPPPRDVAWVMLQPDQSTEEKKAVVERLCRLFPRLKAAQELACDFAQMVRQRSAARLPAWLRAASGSKLKEFVSFARGLNEDFGAVRNAITSEWSNGQLEGQVNRLKLIKRLMYGRAKFDLLRARVLHSM